MPSYNPDSVATIDVRTARRLALVRAGLLKPQWTGLPQRAAGRTRRARQAALRVIRRFGYLQLDTVSIAGARSHAIVLASRLERFEPRLAEELLQPGEPLFEYWGHEASWLPIRLYPLFEFRRRAYRRHPWWGDLVSRHPRMADELKQRIRAEGPLRSLDLEGLGGRGWWDHKIIKKVANALWSTGDLAIRARNNFQRSYDLSERVIPPEIRKQQIPETDAIARLLLRALRGHGWATIGTLAQTWRLTNRRPQMQKILDRLTAEGDIVPCALADGDGRQVPGWIRKADLELLPRLQNIRPRRDKGVLLSPFDPILWDRKRVKMLFDFDQILEIFKPATQRIYGYYCLPVLAGERLVARVDLKADRRARELKVLSLHIETRHYNKSIKNATDEAVRTALARFSEALELATVQRCG